MANDRKELAAWEKNEIECGALAGSAEIKHGGWARRPFIHNRWYSPMLNYQATGN
jgi:hypothetical protein